MAPAIQPPNAEISSVMVASSPAWPAVIFHSASRLGMTKEKIWTSSASSDQPPKHAPIVRRSRGDRSENQESMNEVSSVVACNAEAATIEVTCPCSRVGSDHVEKIEQDDNGNGNTKSPQQNAAHGHTSSNWRDNNNAIKRGGTMQDAITVGWLSDSF